MKTIHSIQLARQALATEARLLAGQQQLLLLAKALRDKEPSTRSDLLDLLVRVYRNYNGGRYGSLLYRLLHRAIVKQLLTMRRRL
ncbi:MAG: hypothetical protein ICV83_02005 [Cytophagales bacterium]|nr:hypothetical protein [Cytophagales bacterium]